MHISTVVPKLPPPPHRQLENAEGLGRPLNDLPACFSNCNVLRQIMYDISLYFYKHVMNHLNEVVPV